MYWVGGLVHFFATLSFFPQPFSTVKLHKWKSSTIEIVSHFWCGCMWMINMYCCYLSSLVYLYTMRLLLKCGGPCKRVCQRADGFLEHARTLPTAREQRWMKRVARKRRKEAERRRKAGAGDLEAGRPTKPDPPPPKPKVTGARRNSYDGQLAHDKLEAKLEASIPGSRGAKGGKAGHPKGVEGDVESLLEQVANLGEDLCGLAVRDVVTSLVEFFGRLFAACSSIDILWRSIFSVSDIPDLGLPEVRLNFGFWSFMHDITVPFTSWNLWSLGTEALQCMGMRLMMFVMLECIVLVVAAFMFGNHTVTYLGVKLQAIGKVKKLPFAGLIAGALPTAGLLLLQNMFTALSSNFFFVINFQMVDQCGVNGFLKLWALMGVMAASVLLNWLAYWTTSGGMNDAPGTLKRIFGIDYKKKGSMAEAMKGMFNSFCGSMWHFFLLWFFLGVYALGNALCLVVGVWPKQLATHMQIGKLAHAYDPNPRSASHPHADVVRFEAHSMGLLWYMLPGTAVVGKFIASANDSPLWIDPESDIKVDAKGSLRAWRWLNNMLLAVSSTGAAFTASAVWMWLVVLVVGSQTLTNLRVTLKAKAKAMAIDMVKEKLGMDGDHDGDAAGQKKGQGQEQGQGQDHGPGDKGEHETKADGPDAGRGVGAGAGDRGRGVHGDDGGRRQGTDSDGGSGAGVAPPTLPPARPPSRSSSTRGIGGTSVMMNPVALARVPSERRPPPAPPQ